MRLEECKFQHRPDNFLVAPSKSELQRAKSEPALMRRAIAGSAFVLQMRYEPRDIKTKKKAPTVSGRGFFSTLFRETIVLGRPGGDLLSHALRHSTIGAEAFNDRVRNGIGF